MWVFCGIMPGTRKTIYAAATKKATLMPFVKQAEDWRLWHDGAYVESKTGESWRHVKDIPLYGGEGFIFT